MRLDKDGKVLTKEQFKEQFKQKNGADWESQWEQAPADTSTLNAADGGGGTPLGWAARYGQWSVVNTLLRTPGIEAEKVSTCSGVITDKLEKTQKMLQELLDSEKKRTRGDPAGVLAGCMKATMGKFAKAQAGLNSLNIDQEGTQVGTPHELAKRNGHSRVAELLRRGVPQA